MHEIPKELARYYAESKPLFLYYGFLQIRSRNPVPSWNNLERYWYGEMAFHPHYNSITGSDIIFAQDGFGDQYFLRAGIVWRLICESDDVECSNKNLDSWLEWISNDPEKNLNIDLSRSVTPGKLLFAFPPLCTNEGATAKLQECPADEVIRVHIGFAAQIRNLEDGERIKFAIK